jgi:SagB-type dehydrogenase family enzyme
MKRSVKSVILCLMMFSAAVAQDIQLPAPQKTGGMPLMEALNARQTQRTFSGKPLSEQQLANLLWAAFGINRDNGKRTAPSAVNWQEIDIYVALPSGLYLYNAPQNSLDQISDQDFRAQIGRQGFTQKAPVGLIYVSETERMKGSETEFYSATDTGFISQNVYLFCASEGMNTVVIGSVDKAALHAAMKLKPSQKIILTQPVGFPPEPAE